MIPRKPLTRGFPLQEVFTSMESIVKGEKYTRLKASRQLPASMIAKVSGQRSADSRTLDITVFRPIGFGLYASITCSLIGDWPGTRCTKSVMSR